MVENVWKCPVCGAGVNEVVLIANESFYTLPHTSGVVSVKVMLHLLLVPVFGIF